MKVTKKLTRINNNLYFPISKEMREYLGIDIGGDLFVEWQDEEKKHGRFVSFWKKKQENNQEEVKKEE